MQGQQISEDLADQIMGIFDLSILDQLAAHAKSDISFTVSILLAIPSHAFVVLLFFV